jgi:hypothetical protein
MVEETRVPRENQAHKKTWFAVSYQLKFEDFYKNIYFTIHEDQLCLLS